MANGMSFRNGTWTSQTFGSDLRDISRLARKIENGEGDAVKLAGSIRRLASSVERDLPRE